MNSRNIKYLGLLAASVLTVAILQAQPPRSEGPNGNSGNKAYGTNYDNGNRHWTNRMRSTNEWHGTNDSHSTNEFHRRAPGTTNSMPGTNGFYHGVGTNRVPNGVTPNNSPAPR